MLLILIPAVFIALFLDLIAMETAAQSPFAIRRAFLAASIWIGLWIAASSELLSLFQGLTRTGAAAAWGVALLAALGIGLRQGLLKRGFLLLKEAVRLLGRGETLPLVGLLAALALLFVIIVYAPVNNSDSLQYHMSRVVHWAQDRSLRHYATGFLPQLVNPIWAEEAILHIRLLWGDDRFAELVQYAAMLGSLIGVSLLAGLLGANRKGQLAAVFFTASIPMGILQATSTQNDYGTSFWLISALCFVVFSARSLRWSSIFYLAGALGLGLLTKGTFYPYAVPVGLWFAYLQLRRFGLGRMIRAGLLLTGVVVVLNLGIGRGTWPPSAARWDPASSLARWPLSGSPLGLSRPRWCATWP